jgi:Putative transposase
MTLDIGEFIRRFLTHVLPKGFHRIRHYGLFASSNRTKTIEAVRKLLDLAPPAAEAMREVPLMFATAVLEFTSSLLTRGGLST